MALSALRVRFIFNQKSGGTEGQRSRQRVGKDFATTLVERLSFAAAEDEYEHIRTTIKSSLERDAKQELTHIAALFRRHIVGAGGTLSKPSGSLSYALGSSDTGVGDDEGIGIGESLPSWAPRTAKYLREKKRRGWPGTWFKATGYLQKNLKASTLLAAFGPIRVTVTRNLKAGSGSVRIKAGGTGKINIATVRVFALSSITPQMLPALRTGQPETPNSDRGNDGLIDLIKNVDPELAYRLGRRSSAATGMRYRPTLEPFLAFYLTRSVPNALALRLTEGRLRQKRRNNG